MLQLDKIEELQNIIKQNPTDFQSRRELAILLIDAGFNEEALQHLLYLSKTFTTDDEIFYNLGIVYEKLRNFEKAKENYEKAIEIDSEFIDAIYNLGLVYTELKMYESAIICFEKVLADDDNDSNSFFNLGLIYFKTKDYDKAMENFQKTIALNDEDIYAHFYIGNIYKDSGDLENARQKFHKVLELSPDYSWAYYNLAVIDFEQGKIESAKQNLSNTIELNPMDEEAYKILIKIFTKEKDMDTVFAIIDSALASCDKVGDFYYIQGEIYKRLRNYPKAKDSFNLALKNSRKLTFPKEIIQKELKSL